MSSVCDLMRLRYLIIKVALSMISYRHSQEEKVWKSQLRVKEFTLGKIVGGEHSRAHCKHQCLRVVKKKSLGTLKGTEKN